MKNKNIELHTTKNSILQKEKDSILEFKDLISWDDKNKDKKVFTLITSQTILMLDKSDVICFDVEPTKGVNVTWRIFIYFVDDNNKVPLSADTTVEHPEKEKASDVSFSLFHLTLNKWYADTWIENKEPFTLISSDNKVEMQLKLRTTASPTQGYRQLIITIWGAEKV